MKKDAYPSQQALIKAKQAYQKGILRDARRWAEEAARLDPGWEEPWLWLAAVSSPRASLEFLKRALEINPSSERARQGVHWALQRLRRFEAQGKYRRQILTHTAPQPVQSRTVPRSFHVAAWPVIAAIAIITVSLAIIYRPGIEPLEALANQSWDRAAGVPVAFVGSYTETSLPEKADKATRTPTHTTTPSPTPTNTPTPTPTDTPTPTPTDTPTDTPTSTPVPTDTPVPTEPQPPTEIPADSPAISNLPEGVAEDENWIDVNLSTQSAYAYQGWDMVRSFVVSTGTWLHPTVTGQYRIYVKYRYADMSGPGYYLPDVPFVMYFYRGYGLHGTYWHNNFGTPMSHGCVNFTIDDAGWLFDFASIGTVVNIHY